MCDWFSEVFGSSWVLKSKKLKKIIKGLHTHSGYCWLLNPTKFIINSLEKSNLLIMTWRQWSWWMRLLVHNAAPVLTHLQNLYFKTLLVVCAKLEIFTLGVTKMPNAFTQLGNVLYTHMCMPHIYHGESDKRLIQLLLNNSHPLWVPGNALGSNTHWKFSIRSRNNA